MTEWTWRLELRLWILLLLVLSWAGLWAVSDVLVPQCPHLWMVTVVTTFSSWSCGLVPVPPLEQCLAASKFSEIVSYYYCHYNFMSSVLTLGKYSAHWVSLPLWVAMSWLWVFVSEHVEIVRRPCQRESEESMSGKNDLFLVIFFYTCWGIRNIFELFRKLKNKTSRPLLFPNVILSTVESCHVCEFSSGHLWNQMAFSVIPSFLNVSGWSACDFHLQYISSVLAFC